MNDRAGPRSATEIQAVVTLKAARDVAENIEKLRAALRDDELPRSRRERLKDDLLEAAERLCNLLDLLLSWVAMVSESVRDPLEQGVSELRTKLLSTGIRLISDRLDRMLKQGRAILDGSEGFPLGISMRLNEALAGLDSTIAALGGLEAMPPEMAEKFDEVQDQVERLREMEDQVGLVKDFDQD
jgi:uncharacterized Zn finger protein